MARESLILDKKTVASSSDGSEMAWFLHQYEDDTSEWKPQVTYANGRQETPSWMPLPGSQYLFLECPVFEVLMEGPRGGGKTLTLVMDFAKEVGKGYGKAWRGILFRQKLGDLDDVVRKIEETFPSLYPGFRFLKSKADYQAIWPTGEALLLRHMEDERSYGEYHGHEYPWIGWEELTQWATDKAYKMMMSCCRPPKPGVPCRVRSTTNPYGCVRFGEVLTADRGWVNIQKVIPGEDVFSVNADGDMVRAKVKEVIKQQWAGEVVKRDGSGIFMEFTDDHRLPYLNTDRSAFSLKPFTDLPGQATIRRTANNTYSGQEAGGADMAAFLGWYLAEGCKVPGEGALCIAQTKSHTVKVIHDLLRRMGLKYRYDGQQFWIYDKKMYALCSVQGKSSERYIPHEWKNGSKEEIESLFNALMAGDGCGNVYYTISKQLADDVAEIAIKLGKAVYISSRLRENRVHPCYQVNISDRDVVQLVTGNHACDVTSTCSNVNVTRESWSGEVFCLNVPDTETFFIRQKGSVWLSGNSGHNWIKRRFQLPQMRGRVIRKPGEMPRVAIHSTLAENFLLLHNAPNYPLQIREASANPAQAQAWLEGRWDITAGGMIDDIWDRGIHILPTVDPGRIPAGWEITRAYDHGQSSPFACGWFLESNGEPMDIGGRLIGNVRGDIILWNEWYGTTGNDNEGVRLAARKIAAGIADREVEWGFRRPGSFRSRVCPGPADTEIYNKHTDRHGRCPADDMEDEGVDWERADKSSGSRKRGWEMLRTKLQNAIPNPDGSREHPGFFVCENCSWWLEICPPMPRDERDLDEVPATYEDHLPDMTRYRLNWELPGMTRRSF